VIRSQIMRTHTTTGAGNWRIKPLCHPEQSEGSVSLVEGPYLVAQHERGLSSPNSILRRLILRYAQDDTGTGFYCPKLAVYASASAFKPKLISDF
jgi:hypothetical protein